MSEDTRPTTVEPSWRRPFEAIDPASLAFFRIALGLVLTWEAWRFLAHGWAISFYVDPPVHFRYFGFEWVEALSAVGMVRLFQVLGAVSVMLALGVLPRVMSGLLCVGWTYVFLLEQGRYLNHMYLLSMLLGIMAFLPSGHDLSVMQLFGRPRRRIPAVGVLTLRTQMGLVYLFAGIAKLNGDWLAGHPLDSWLGGRAELPVLGPLLEMPLAGITFAWSGMAIDMIAWPALEHRSGRYTMFALLGMFHLTNFYIFHIGIFPWMGLAITTLWLPPHWPRRVLGLMSDAAQAVVPRRRRLVLGLCALWFTYQFAMPLRHHLYPGNVAWNEQGHRFSWRMKLRSKQGDSMFRVVYPALGEERLVDPGEELTRWQMRKMSTRPDMALQYAHVLRDRARAEGHDDVRVHAWIECSLNGRDPELLLDPEADLARIERSLSPASWITEGPFGDDEATALASSVEDDAGDLAESIEAAAQAVIDADAATDGG